METNSSSDLTPRAARPDHSVGSAVAVGSISITRAASFRVGSSSGATTTSGSTHRGSVSATARNATCPASSATNAGSITMIPGRLPAGSRLGFQRGRPGRRSRTA